MPVTGSLASAIPGGPLKSPQQLVPVTRPTERPFDIRCKARRQEGIRSSTIRDLPREAGIGIALDVYLPSAGFVRDVGEPPAVGRQRRESLVERGLEERSRPAFRVHGKRPDVRSGCRVRYRISDVTAVRRPASVVLRPFVRGQAFECRGVVDKAEIEIEHAFPVGRPDESPSVGGPFGPVVLRSEGQGVTSRESSSNQWSCYPLARTARTGRAKSRLA